MKDKILLTLSIIQTAVLIAILILLLSDRQQPSYRHATSKAKTELYTRVEKPLVIYADDVIWGKKSAPNTIIAYVDYQCPYCAEIFSNLKKIEKEYITTGKAKVIFRDFPLKMHPEARKFAIAVECARRQGKFWEMAEIILQSQGKEAGNSVEKWMEKIDLNKEDFASCLADSTINEVIEKDISEARSYKVHGTPAIFINDIFYRGTQSVSTLRDILEGKKPLRKAKSGSCG